MTMNGGYYVWNPDANRPTFRHDNLQSAITEAERLAGIHKCKFIVLRYMGSAQPSKPAPFVLADDVRREQDGELPF